MSSDQPSQIAPPGLSPDAIPPQRTDFSLLSPSARTSFTRVDLAAEEEQDRVNATSQSPPPDIVDETEAQPTVEPAVPQTPQVSLTFLTVSGRRRTMSFEPETTIGRVKELVWNAWPNEWQDERPPAPSYLRILYLGKILQDEDTLIKIGFPTHIPASTGVLPNDSTANPTAPTIVHLSIRAYPPPGARDTPKKLSIRRSSAVVGQDESPSAGCCASCVVC